MAEPAVLSIGNFDGVHRGHQAIVAQARALAQARGCPAKVMTFDPFPARMLRPATAPAQIVPLTERVKLLRQAGADEVVVLAPTPDFLDQTAEQFLDWLQKTHPLAGIVEGADFRFGKGRTGDMTYLAAQGRKYGFAVQAVEAVRLGLSDLMEVPVSSTLIRWLVAHGRVRDAHLALGRPFALTARVVQGEQRGRKLGFPTINLDNQALADLVPIAHGVYAGRATLADGREFPAAISVGVKPTFQGLHRVIEAHLLHFTGDLYGQTVTLHFIRWLRDQQAFPSVELLRTQLQRDLKLAEVG